MNEQKQQQCEAADYGMSDCENLATTTVKIDGERVPACQECYDIMRDLWWEQAVKFARR